MLINIYDTVDYRLFFSISLEKRKKKKVLCYNQFAMTPCSPTRAELTLPLRVNIFRSEY